MPRLNRWAPSWPEKALPSATSAPRTILQTQTGQKKASLSGQAAGSWASSWEGLRPSPPLPPQNQGVPLAFVLGVKTKQLPQQQGPGPGSKGLAQASC